MNTLLTRTLLFIFIKTPFLFAMTIVNLADQKTNLIFPLENNAIEVLPPRFEYELVDKDQIRIGNIQIDTSQIQFKIKTLDHGKKIFKIYFQWPVGLLAEGEIAIKDNSGKSLWIKKFTTHEVLTSTKTTLAYFETVLDSDELLNNLQEFPFFSFCIHNELIQTKIYLCSKEFFITQHQTHYTVQERAQSRSDSFVEINGQIVGPKGFVFLNSPKESVSMRTLLMSGSTLDIETRMKKIDFKNLSISVDKKELILVGQGAEPVKQSQHSLREEKNNLWSARMSTEDPFVYLYGEGGLPLRYEFLAKQEPHVETTHVEILSPVDSTTINSTYQLKLKPPLGYILQPADKKSKLTNLNDGTYDWTLQELKKDQKQRRYLFVESKNMSDKKKYVAGFDIERQSFLHTEFKVLLPLALQGRISLSHIFEYPIEFNFFYKNKIDYNDNNTNLSIYSFASHWPIFKYAENQSLTLDGALNSFKLDSHASNILNMGITHQLENNFFLTNFISEFQTRVNLFVLPLDSDSVIHNGSFEIELNANKKMIEDISLNAGFKFQSFTFEKSSFQQLYSFFSVGLNF